MPDSDSSPPAPEPARPQGEYYEVRFPAFSQGDIFGQLTFKFADEPSFEPEGTRRALSMLSGIFTGLGFGMMVSPTCNIRAQGVGENTMDPPRYSHPVRVMIPIAPLSILESSGVLTSDQILGLKGKDHSGNYMYLPPSDQYGIPEGCAVLFMPISMGQSAIEGKRMAQLTEPAAQQLQKKLVQYWTGGRGRTSRSEFTPPMN